MTTTPHRPALSEAADEYSRLALHNLQESEKIQRWRKRRLEMLRGEARQSIATRPTTIHDEDSLVWSYASNDPKLKEYGAGIEITERRAAMYASMATDLRLQAVADLLLSIVGRE